MHTLKDHELHALRLAMRRVLVLDGATVRADEPLDPKYAAKLAKSVARLRIGGYLNVGPGGRVVTTFKGDHAEHDTLYSRWQLYDARATRKRNPSHQAHARKALAALRAFEDANSQLPRLAPPQADGDPYAAASGAGLPGAAPGPQQPAQGVSAGGSGDSPCER